MWAQLVSITDLEAPVTEIRKDTFVLGRNSECDLSHSGNKLVSGKHCYIQKDKDGLIWLYDTSTNGTLLNLKAKILKGERRELKHGDKIHLVHRNLDTKDNIGYRFDVVNDLLNEYSSDDTVDYDYEAKLTDNSVKTAAAGPSALIRKSLDDECSTPCKKLSIRPEPSYPDGEGLKNETKDDPGKQLSAEAACPLGDPNIQPIRAAALSLEKCDSFGENLVCIICQDLLYDCVSLQPCMHSFCSGCYSEWMEKSNECPFCRLKVERINKNHLLNTLVESYIKMRPEKKRPAEELEELDKKNKITRDMLYPVSSQTNLGCSFSEEDEDWEVCSWEPCEPVLTGINKLNDMLWDRRRTNSFPRPVCRQCPEFLRIYAGEDGFNLLFTPVPSTSTAAMPADDPDAGSSQVAKAFTCTLDGNHIMCQCCAQAMPDRRNETVHLPPMCCQICHSFFCHAYWGCLKPGCNGCLGKFKDMKFAKKDLDLLILDNPVESEIFNNYLEMKRLTIKDVWQACLDKMTSRNYNCPDRETILSKDGVNTPICYSCALKNFKELAYLYRMDINTDMPEEVTKRDNCFWGRNCRTQRIKTAHSLRFNHICEQTRFI